MNTEPQSETPNRFEQWLKLLEQREVHIKACPLDYILLSTKERSDLCDKVRNLERDRGEANKKIERYHDLVRYQRAELHQADLITDDEYTSLLSDSKSVARLEGYDKLQQELSQMRGELETAQLNLETTGRVVLARDASIAELAKQNHLFRNAIDKIRLECSPKSFTTRGEYEAIQKFLVATLSHPDLSSLLVLTRTEVTKEQH